MLVAFIAVLGGLFILFWIIAPRVAPWTDELTRLNPGAGAKAEWMASPEIVEQVAWDYHAAQEWLATCVTNWGRFAAGLERYTAGAYLKHQRRVLAFLMERQPRLALKQFSAHEVSVRRFSADGLRCLLIDHQASRILTTVSYWTGRTLHRQRLEDAALVYQMLYDIDDKRWKIERLIQELPLGAHSTASKESRVIVAANLPTAFGRDS